MRGSKKFTELKEKMKNKITTLEKKLDRKFYFGNKKKIVEDLEVLNAAYESMIVLYEMEKYFDVAKKEVTEVSDKLIEKKTVATLITTLVDVNDIPALEATIFKQWKDKYGTIFIPVVPGENNGE